MTSNPVRPLLQGLCLVGALSAGACASRAELGEVEGTVVLNGKPVADVEVMFLPDPVEGTTGPRSTGITDANGHYLLVCDDQRPGAVVGKHRVVVTELKSRLPAAPRGPRATDPRAAAQAKAASARDTSVRIPGALRDAASTPLKKEVRPGRQIIDLDLSAVR
jgi:hypothetical protein